MTSSVTFPILGFLTGSKWVAVRDDSHITNVWSCFDTELTLIRITTESEV